MVTFFLTHKGNFSIFLPRKSNVLSINSRPIILTIQNIRVIYIYRDGRDVAASYYQYETRVGNFRGSFKQFIRTKMNRHFGSWHAHVLKAMEFSRANPQRVLLLQYERMLENTFESVKEMVIFYGIIANEARLKKAVKLCSFERLKKVESGEHYRFVKEKSKSDSSNLKPAI